MQSARFDLPKLFTTQLAAAGSEAERIAAAFELPQTVKFQRARKLIRDALTEFGIAPHIDERLRGFWINPLSAPKMWTTKHDMTSPRQGDLFRNDDASEERETPTWYPDPEEVRTELHAIWRRCGRRT